MLPAKVATRAIAPRSLACRWGTKCALVEYDRCFPAIVRWARLPSPPTWRWARSKPVLIHRHVQRIDIEARGITAYKNNQIVKLWQRKLLCPKRHRLDQQGRQSQSVQAGLSQALDQRFILALRAGQHGAGFPGRPEPGPTSLRRTDRRPEVWPGLRVRPYRADRKNVAVGKSV